MKALSHALAVALLLALAACATPKKSEPDAPKAAPPTAAEVPIRDKFVIPGERAGPILLGMSLRKLVEVVGEPISSTAARIPSGRSALLYRYADPDASPDGAMLVIVRETDQTVYSIQLDRIESFQTREGVRYGSSEALVRASFGKPQSCRAPERHGTCRKPDGVSRLRPAQNLQGAVGFAQAPSVVLSRPSSAASSVCQPSSAQFTREGNSRISSSIGNCPESACRVEAAAGSRSNFSKLL